MRTLKRPVVGVVSKPRDLDGRFSYVLANSDIAFKILDCGGLPVGLLPLDRGFVSESFVVNSYELNDYDRVNLDDVLRLVDGVVLQGGLVLNGYEEYIARVCLKQDKPVLGICCGFDVMLKATGHEVKLGGGESFHWNMDVNFTHEISLNKDSFFYSVLGIERTRVNSIHKSVVFPDKINDEVWNIGAVCSDDGSVEVIESLTNRFAFGVRFHPELMNDGFVDSIFKSFVESCKI